MLDQYTRWIGKEERGGKYKFGRPRPNMDGLWWIGYIIIVGGWGGIGWGLKFW